MSGALRASACAGASRTSGHAVATGPARATRNGARTSIACSARTRRCRREVPPRRASASRRTRRSTEARSRSARAAYSRPWTRRRPLTPRLRATSRHTDLERFDSPPPSLCRRSTSASARTCRCRWAVQSPATSRCAKVRGSSSMSPRFRENSMRRLRSAALCLCVRAERSPTTSRFPATATRFRSRPTVRRFS